MSDFTGPEQYQNLFDPKAYLDDYYRLEGDCMGDEYLRFSLKHLAQIYSSGKVKGETLIDIGSGPTIYPLLSACEVYKNIICTDFTDRNREELKAWLTNQPGSFDWSPVVKLVCQLEGDKVPWTEKEDHLRRTIKQVLKCDILESNPTDPVVLPQADGLISFLCFEAACKDQPAYVSALNNITTLLKPGGYLVLSGVLGNTYYMVGKVKFSGILLTEDFIKEALRGAGYTIVSFERSDTTEESFQDKSNFNALYLVLAQKKCTGLKGGSD
ncbi:nicotinamide N-methyltransferase-like [Hyperolius riggenbachi]|uniref:nicotinamide N-methyltransferase-like n=1 Tax=Hyperolius riggenbachi TaxID=752182 RepID=UPI0035A3AD2B